LREENGASPGGIGGAAGPELGDVNGDGNSPVNADVPYVSQAENADNLRNYWRHDLDATLGWLAHIPPADYEKRLERFRHCYGRIVEMARDSRTRLEIREAFSKVWNRWRRRSPALYPEELREQIFTEAEIEREVWAIGWGRIANLPLFEPPMAAEVAAMLSKHRGRDRFVAWLTCHPHLLAEVIPHLQDRDVPRDLVLFVYKFVLVAVREPEKLAAFRLEYPDVFNRLKRPLLREAQARVDALNGGTTVIINEEPAVDEPVKPAVIEVAPPAASSLPPDDQEQRPADAIGLGLYVPDLPPNVRVQYVDAIAGLLEHERAPVGPPEIEEELSPALPAAEERRPRRAIDIASGNANYGWPVFPCDPKTKKPLTPREKDPKTGKPIDGTGWRKQATTNFGIIRHWWAEYPKALVGIPTCEAIGAFVLEIDVADKAGNVYTTVEAQIAAVEAELGVNCHLPCG
jgi:hypothetical protein